MWHEWLPRGNAAGAKSPQVAQVNELFSVVLGDFHLSEGCLPTVPLTAPLAGEYCCHTAPFVFFLAVELERGKADSFIV